MSNSVKWLVLAIFQGKADEEMVKIKAKAYKGRWEGGGVVVPTGVRDIGYLFPTRTLAKAFWREVEKIKGVSEAFVEEYAERK